MAMTTLLHAWPSRQKSRGLIGYSRYNVNYKKLFDHLPQEISVNLARAESQINIGYVFSYNNYNKPPHFERLPIPRHTITNHTVHEVNRESYTYLLIAECLLESYVFTLHSEHVVPRSLDSHSITSIKRLDQAI